MNENEMNQNNDEISPDNGDMTPQGSPNTPKNGGSGFKIRAISSIFIVMIYIAVVVLSISFSTYVFDGFVLIAAFLASFEVARAISNKFAKPIFPFVIINIILGYGVFFVIHNVFNYYSGGITSYFMLFALVVVALIVYNMFTEKFSMDNVLSTIFVMIYPTTALIYMLGLAYLPTSLSYNAIVFAFMLPAFTDTAAYLFGSLLRGPKLCPTISPKKTISGAIGGIFGGMVAGGIVMLFAVNGILNIEPLATNTIMNVVHYLVIGAIGAVFVQVGDLIASYIKRQVGVKDFGNLIKGHGGIMDRIDSMIMSSLFLFIYFSILAI